MLNGPMKAPASGDAPKSLVVFLHGIGADGNDLISLSDEFADDLPDTMFLSPHAPTAYGGGGYQWFPLYDTSEPAMMNGAAYAAEALDAYIDAQTELHELSIDKVALVGFSQGTMTALYTMLRRPQACAGIVGYSGLLLGGKTLRDEIRSKPPVCLVHGSTDMIVPFVQMAEAEAALRSAGVAVESHLRPGLGHGIDALGIRYGRDFLRQRL